MFVKKLNYYIFLKVMCNNSKISQRYFLNALFLNIMQFISPFYDENSRRSMDLKYKNVSVRK